MKNKNLAFTPGMKKEALHNKNLSFDLKETLRCYANLPVLSPERRNLCRSAHQYARLLAKWRLDEFNDKHDNGWRPAMSTPADLTFKVVRPARNSRIQPGHVYGCTRALRRVHDGKRFLWELRCSCQRLINIRPEHVLLVPPFCWHTDRSPR